MYFKKEDKFEFNKWEQLQYIGITKYSIKVMAKILVSKSMGVTLALKCHFSRPRTRTNYDSILCLPLGTTR